jgi:hypothetical protein
MVKPQITGCSGDWLVGLSDTPLLVKWQRERHMERFAPDGTAADDGERVAHRGSCGNFVAVPKGRRRGLAQICR